MKLTEIFNRGYLWYGLAGMWAVNGVFDLATADTTGALSAVAFASLYCALGYMNYRSYKRREEWADSSEESMDSLNVTLSEIRASDEKHLWELDMPEHSKVAPDADSDEEKAPVGPAGNTGAAPPSGPLQL